VSHDLGASGKAAKREKKGGKGGQLAFFLLTPLNAIHTPVSKRKKEKAGRNHLFASEYFLS